MHNTDEYGPPPSLRIGAPERLAARDALEEHLDDERLDPDEFARRVAACDEATNQAELLRIFADLPVPHPELPSSTPSSTDEDDDVPPGVVGGCVTLALGVPVAVLLGFVYGAWWALAVPVAVTVLMTYVENLSRASRRHPDSDAARRAD